MRPIDGTKIKEYLTCPRIPYLSFHLPKSRELPPSERMRVLFSAGHQVEERILSAIAPEKVKFKLGDWEAGSRATNDAMDRGAPAISNGVLVHEHCLGRPDLLLKNSDGGYDVADVKSASRVHASARLQVAFYARMLALTRRAPARVGHVILRDGQRESFDLADLDASVDHLLERLGAFRLAPGADPGPHRIDACTECRWREVCDDELIARDDLSLVPGLTRAQRDALHDAGVTNVAALLAHDDVLPLAAAANLSHDLVLRVQLRARAVRAGRPLRAGAPRPELRLAKFALAACFADRLGEPAVALAGLVLDDSGRFRVRFLRSRESTDPDGELNEMVTNLLRSTGPILVHGAHVEQTLEAVRDRIAGDAVDQLEARLVDLRTELRRAVALPGSDRTAVLATRSAGLAEQDSSADLPALAWLEELGGDVATGRAAIEATLKRDLLAIERLRRLALELGESA